MSDFPHLKLPFKVEGSAISRAGGTRNKEAKAKTDSNKNNRIQHGEYLKQSAKALLEKWNELKSTKKAEGIELSNENEIPVFLKIDTEVFDIDKLTNWGIELISEEEEGFIIGASVDSFKAFSENVDEFIKEQGQRKDKAAQIWEMVTDDSWRILQLLKGELGQIWGGIISNQTYIVELGVSCYTPSQKPYPKWEKFDSEPKFITQVDEYKESERVRLIERDDKQRRREEQVEQYLHLYGGELLDIWDNQEDAVYFKISINGSGLKDIVQTFQYLFEVKLESKYLLDHDAIDFEDEFHCEIEAPAPNASKVCVIDSGIQENHRLIQAAIDNKTSRSYIDDDISTADYVKKSGHGTKVAGAILYPYEIPRSGQIKLESIIQNARVLNGDNRISRKKFGPSLMKQIIKDYSETRIFNLCVCDDDAYIGTHMPSVAASLDNLQCEKDILFIVAAGNLPRSSVNSQNPGIKQHLEIGNNYPNYLDNPESKIANPGVSYFSITVGSIAKENFEDEDYKAIAGVDRVSPFSRTGLGLWGCLKPDVVEFGGDLLQHKRTFGLTTNPSILPELVNSTLFGASAVGKDDYGTSFSAPKVSYIASRLQNEHPLEPAQMYRALIIQSARLPEHCFYNPGLHDIRYYGYGMPDVDRALNNSESRITFIQSGKVGPKKADIYRLNIPKELTGEGKEFRILIEVTLAFTSRTRITRKGSHSYLANWLEWQSSKYNEGFNSFRNRTIAYLETDEDVLEAGVEFEGSDSIKWVLRENPKWTTNGINRNNSTVQKSWTIVDPHRFADEFSLAVIGHSGWDKNLENIIPYSLCVSFEVFDAQINIYNLLAEAQVEVEAEQEIEV